MPLSLDESYAYCRSLARRTAGNFYFSFLTLPADRVRDMCALYAFMRISDDLGDDETHSVGERRRQLDAWRDHLRRALEEEDYRHELFPALTEVVRRHRIPPEYLFAVIDGVRRDLGTVSFGTFEELADYCYQVAGVVGLCCIHVWGFRGDEAIDRAIDCGLAFQLTNILRDLGEDAAMGRVYLPQEDLDRFGYSVEDLLAGRRDDRFRRLMQFEVERARRYYDRSAKLLALLEPPGRAVYAAMRRIYGGVLTEIERRDYDVFSRRVRLPAWRKLGIAAAAIVRHRLLGRWLGSSQVPKPTGRAPWV
ncbi:MAG: phytoene/squalene synthase family protein [Planctomycetaceae bacterium]